MFPYWQSEIYFSSQEKKYLRMDGSEPHGSLLAFLEPPIDDIIPFLPHEETGIYGNCRKCCEEFFAKINEKTIFPEFTSCTHKGFDRWLLAHITFPELVSHSFRISSFNHVANHVLSLFIIQAKITNVTIGNWSNIIRLIFF